MELFTFPDAFGDFELLNITISIRCTIELEESVYSAIESEMGESNEEEIIYGSYFQNITLFGQSAQIRGFVGACQIEEEGVEETGAESSPECLLHYDFNCTTRETTTQLDETSDNWEKLNTIVATTLNEHMAFIRVFLTVPWEDVLFAVKIPIQLNESAISGFSEIRGVRLAAIDPDSEDEVLYSIILDQYNGEAAIDFRGTLDLELNENIFYKAVERALSIIKFVVTKTEMES